MLHNLGMWEILLILFIVLLFFGAKRLPEIGRSLGKGIREFKGSLTEVEEEMKEIRGGEGDEKPPSAGTGTRKDDAAG